MAGAFRAASSFGDTQATAVASPQNIAIPTSGTGGTVIAGDVAELYVDADLNPTLTTPSGWTLRSGPDDPSTSARSWVFTRTLQAGDPGANVSLAGWAGSIRISAVIVVKSGVTETGIQIDKVSDGTATGTYTLPTLTGVPAGAVLTAAFLRRRSGAAGVITVPSPYTAQTNTDPANTYAAGANTFQRSGTVVTGGGSVGGESGSTGVTSIGTNYLVSLPVAQADATIPVPSAFGPVRTQDVAASASATQTVPSAFVPVHTQDVGLAADTALAVPSAAVQVVADPAAPGTAIPVPSAFVPVRTQDVALIGDVAVPVPTAYVGVHPQPVTLVVDAAVAVPSALVEVFTTAPRPAVYYRYQWWDGTAWHRIAPVVWDGTAWVEIPVTVTRPD